MVSSFRFRTLTQIFALAAILISVPLLAGTVSAFFYIKGLSSDSRTLVVRSLEIGRESEKLVDHINELNRTAQQYIVVRDEELYKLYARKHQRLIEILDWLKLLVDKEEALHVLQDIRGVSNTAFERLQDFSESPEREIDAQVFDRLAGLSEDLRFFSDTAIRNQLDRAAQRVETARWVLYWVWGISSVLVVAFVVVLTWFIARPLRRMDSHIRRLGRGYFDDPIRVDGPADITELADRLDWLRIRLVEVDQIKEQFFREMSHQLKTPLASIREGADLLLEQPRDDNASRQSEVVELLHNNSVELQRMLDNMLNFSAWRAKPGHLHKERFRIKPLVESVVRRLQTRLLGHDIDVKMDCPDDLEVEMDREKCRVIFDNLLSNAVKYSPEQGVIFIRIASGRSAVRMEVSDQGPGVPFEYRDRIFELFSLGDGPASDGTRGSGIGLALVKAYVQAHGGDVSVDSSENNGARFRIAIPH